MKAMVQGAVILAGFMAVPTTTVAMAGTPSQAPSAQSITFSNTALHTRYQEAPFAFGTFALTNHSNTDLLLQGITSPACHTVTSNRNSQVAIQAPSDTDDIFQRMAIPHEGTLVFPTGGYHLICHGLQVTYQPGKTVPFTFHFQNIGNLTVSFTMQPIVEERHVGP